MDTAAVAGSDGGQAYANYLPALVLRFFHDEMPA
jgi:hypothetical protein